METSWAIMMETVMDLNLEIMREIVMDLVMDLMKLKVTNSETMMEIH
jgi:hypothetical protein